jgi:hypothetical protein
MKNTKQTAKKGILKPMAEIWILPDMNRQNFAEQIPYQYQYCTRLDQQPVLRIRIPNPDPDPPDPQVF